jgi:hypothetical protein
MAGVAPQRYAVHETPQFLSGVGMKNEYFRGGKLGLILA